MKEMTNGTQDARLAALIAGWAEKAAARKATREKAAPPPEKEEDSSEKNF